MSAYDQMCRVVELLEEAEGIYRGLTFSSPPQLSEKNRILLGPLRVAIHDARQIRDAEKPEPKTYDVDLHIRVTAEDAIQAMKLGRKLVARHDGVKVIDAWQVNP